MSAPVTAPAGADRRLVLPAAAGWATASLLLGAAGQTRAWLAGVVLLGLAVVCWRGLRRGAGAHRARWPRHWGAAALVLVTVGVVIVSLEVQTRVREPPELQALVQWDAPVPMTLRLTGAARPAAADFDGTGRLRANATLIEANLRGQRYELAVPVLLLAPAGWQDLAPGTEVQLTGQLRSAPPGQREVALVTTEQVPVLQRAPPRWESAAAALRAGLHRAVQDLPPHAAGLLPGIAVGDDSRVPSLLVADMRTTSLGHLLAVSGAHVAILLSLVLLVAGALAVAARLALGLAVLAGLVVLVGAEPSVVRACAMGGVVLLALALGRRSQALPALATAVIVLVITDPWIAPEPGFMLSVAATAGLILWSTPLTGLIADRLGRGAWIAPAIAVPLAAQLGCLPVLLALQPGLATYGVLANALVAPVIPGVTVLALLATVLIPVLPGVAGGLLWSAQWGTWWIERVATTVADFPLATLPWPGGIGGLVWAAGAGGGLWLLRRRIPALLAVTGVALTVTVVVLALVPALRPVLIGLVGTPSVPANWRVVVCDVGQGSAALVSTAPAGGGSEAVLLDVGPPDGGVGECLRAAGVERIALLVLSHGDLDHVGALADVVATVPVERVLLPAVPDARLAAAADLARSRGASIVRADAEAADRSVGALAVSIWWPSARAIELAPAVLRAEDGNGLGLVVEITAPDLRLLAPGDVDAAAQGEVLRTRPELVPVDLLLVPHHGSRDQDPGLLAALSPALAVVSAGLNNDYGHPAPDTVDLLERGGAQVVRTDECGTLALARGEASDGGAPAANQVGAAGPLLLSGCEELGAW